MDEVNFSKIHKSGADKFHYPTPWASAFIGRSIAFIEHKFIMDKWKARLGKSYEIFCQPQQVDTLSFI